MRRIHLLRWAVAAFAFGIVMYGTEAKAIPLLAGQTLDVTFTALGPESVNGGAFTGAGGRLVDTLSFTEFDNLSQPANGFAQLFNGTTLLGSLQYTAQSGQIFVFTAPGSGFTNGTPGIVSDWSSFINGTINGILKITLDRSADVTIGFATVGVGFSGSGIRVASPGLNVTGESVETAAAVPEPATLSLLTGALAMLSFAGWRSRQRG